MRNTVTTSFTLNIEDVERLEAVCKRRQVNRSALVRDLLQRGLKDLEHEERLLEMYTKKTEE